MKLNTSTLLLFGAAGAAAFYFFKGKADAAKSLRFEPVDFKIDLNRTRQSLFTRLYYTIKINVVNPERLPVGVRLVNLKVSSGGASLGDLTSAKPFTIPARSNQIVPIDAAISVFGALGPIINFIKNRKPIPVNVSGYITSDLGQLDIDYNTNVGAGIGAPNPDEELVKIESLKKKDIFFPRNSKVAYIFIGYNRAIKRYEGQAYEDISKFRSFKKGTLVDIGREY